MLRLHFRFEILSDLPVFLIWGNGLFSCFVRLWRFRGIFRIKIVAAFCRFFPSILFLYQLRCCLSFSLVLRAFFLSLLLRFFARLPSVYRYRSELPFSSLFLRSLYPPFFTKKLAGETMQVSRRDYLYIWLHGLFLFTLSYYSISILLSSTFFIVVATVALLSFFHIPLLCRFSARYTGVCPVNIHPPVSLLFEILCR